VKRSLRCEDAKVLDRNVWFGGARLLADVVEE
jgi:hypothetical protein